MTQLVAGRIVHGDALELLAGHPAGSVDLVFIDWPYSQMQPVRGRDIGAAGRLFGPMSFLFRLLSAVHWIASPGAHLYLFGDWRGIPDAGYALSVTGWFPTTIVSWDKRFAGTGGIWRSSWDPIFFASKGPADRRSEKAHRNVIAVPSVRGRGDHPAEKPAELWRELCSVSVKGGTRVLDPFAGSGSSRGPVEERGGVWYGIDIDPQWADR